PRLMAPVRRARADISAKTVVPNSASRRLRRGRALEVMAAILRRTSGVPQLCFGPGGRGASPGHAPEGSPRGAASGGSRGITGDRKGSGAMEIGVISIVLAVLFFGVGWAGARNAGRKAERSGRRRGRGGGEGWWAGGHGGAGAGRRGSASAGVPSRRRGPPAGGAGPRGGGRWPPG